MGYLRERMGITRRISLAVSDHVAVPTVVGILWPLVLVPPAALAGFSGFPEVSGVSAEHLRLVLAHELAHVVSGSFGSGPFRVAGPLGGLIPDPGRIEGIAVAASPGEDDDFTLFEWSKALLDLNLLPEGDGYLLE